MRLEAIAAIGAILIAGCAGGSDTDTGGSTEDGTLTIRWTIEGGKDGGACAKFGATDLELVVYDDKGNFVAEAGAPCGQFAITVALAPGAYDANVTLVDSKDVAKSLTLPLQKVDVTKGEDKLITIDFPTASQL